MAIVWNHPTIVVKEGLLEICSPGSLKPPWNAEIKDAAPLMTSAPPTIPTAANVTPDVDNDLPFDRSATTHPALESSSILLSSRVACRAISGTEYAIEGILEAYSSGIVCLLEPLNLPTGTAVH